jgi:oxygen-independent coproporphyrinogen-3 oxidase
MKTRDELIRKYDVPVPRYTSYPTVPCWDVDNFSTSGWLRAVERAFDESNESKGISLYIHLPFCESLCTYCACNTRITKNHHVELRYIQAVLDEWELYRYVFGAQPLLRELHLGGGTPTFFSPQNLRHLLESILKNCSIHPQHEFSFEGHPNNTAREHLHTLADLGFRRVSFGVQDLDPRVQEAIHRLQPLSHLQRAVQEARQEGFTSIGFDLIYGLPYQTVPTISNTFREVIRLNPDRIAFYSYAHVPWLKPGQRGYEDADLPTDVQKRELYETGRALLLEAGYHEIGMDHFARRHDALFRMRECGKLHRNFMGYTTSNTDLLIGLGASAISDAKYAYAQNLKGVEEYESLVSQQNLPILKGHLQTPEDQLIRRCIQSISCQSELDARMLHAVKTEKIEETLHEMEDEEIIEFHNGTLHVTAEGNAFIRNICRVFDKRQDIQQHVQKPIFSKSI